MHQQQQMFESLIGEKDALICRKIWIYVTVQMLMKVDFQSPWTISDNYFYWCQNLYLISCIFDYSKWFLFFQTYIVFRAWLSHIWEIFSSSSWEWTSLLGFGSQGWDLGLKAGIWDSRPRFWPLSQDLGLKVRIWASRLGFGLETGICASRLELEPQGWDLSIEVGIWALRLRFEHLGLDLSLKAEIWASRLEFGPWG